MLGSLLGIGIDKDDSGIGDGARSVEDDEEADEAKREERVTSEEAAAATGVASTAVTMTTGTDAVSARCLGTAIGAEGLDEGGTRDDVETAEGKSCKGECNSDKDDEDGCAKSVEV